LPQSWTDDPERCRKAGVPEKYIVAQTRHQHALEMIKGRGHKLPHSWIAGDDEMGKVPWFRRALRDLSESYLLAVPSNILICEVNNIAEKTYNDNKKNVDKFADNFISVSKWAKSIPSSQWKKIKVRQGHKGWLTVNLVVCDVRAKIDNEIGEVETLVVSRWRDDTNKPRCDYYLSYNKSAPVELEEYARVIKQAYRIEECFHRAKGECGLADYQVRNWRG
jgi:hypothetical protein